jgi:hypothetical protein
LTHIDRFLLKMITNVSDFFPIIVADGIRMAPIRDG